MAANIKQHAVHALLSEYKKSIAELQEVFQNISDEKLAFIVDFETKNKDCQSVQSVLAHVVNSGYAYCIYIRKSRNESLERPKKAIRQSAQDYINDLNQVILFTEETFQNIYDNELERFTDSEKMKTSWGQFYDLEQLFEHAIVHILRHRRQIESFKTLLAIS